MNALRVVVVALLIVAGSLLLLPLAVAVLLVQLAVDAVRDARRARDPFADLPVIRDCDRVPPAPKAGVR